MIPFVPQDKVDLQRRRVTLWDTVKKRKLAGMSSPLVANLERYLRWHPEYEAALTLALFALTHSPYR